MRRSIRRATAVTAMLAAVLTVAGCARPVPAPSLTPGPAAVDVRLDENLRYGTRDGHPLSLDLCRPGKPTNRAPLVVLLHGGGFEEGDKTAMRGLCEQLARAGIPAASVQYSLLPTYRYPTQIEDVADAMAWLRTPDRAKQYGVDPARIALVGSSAGAIIAESLAVGMGGQQAVPKAAVLLSPASDLTPAGLKLGTPGKEAQQTVLAYLGCRVLTTCAAARSASPLARVSARSAPMLIVNGTEELVPEPQARALHTALDRAHVANSLQIVQGSGHGLALLNAGVRADMTRFLSDHL